MRYLALATGFDDTLATDGRVSGAAVAALGRVRASGRRTILVTGRRLDDLPRLECARSSITSSPRTARCLTTRRAELADKAEASRFADLQARLDAGLRGRTTRSDERHAATLARLDGINCDFGAALEHTESAIAASVGELTTGCSGALPRVDRRAVRLAATESGPLRPRRLTRPAPT